MVEKIDKEEFCNLALTLCHMVDKMMTTYLKKLEQQFVTEGGIKERMYAARTGYRQAEKEHLQFLEQENTRLRQENTTLQQENTRLRQILATHGIEL